MDRFLLHSPSEDHVLIRVPSICISSTTITFLCHVSVMLEQTFSFHHFCIITRFGHQGFRYHHVFSSLRSSFLGSSIESLVLVTTSSSSSPVSSTHPSSSSLMWSSCVKSTTTGFTSLLVCFLACRPSVVATKWPGSRD